jgi:glutamate N-acetyltransferase/amino-acid N-acetyltransferase
MGNSTTISPLAPKQYPDMPAIDGVRIATAQAGIKYKGRTDVLVMVFDQPAAVAGVFTTSRCSSAPVDACRANLSGGTARALVVNSGNANAFTGSKGRETTRLTAEAASAAVGCDLEQVFLSSTGVIGEPLDAGKFTGLLAAMVKSASPERWADAAHAIMTTDTYPKMVTKSIVLDGTSIAINGISKGAGMIAPDMATMLSYVVTDAPVAADVLQSLLSKAVGTSFNAITVDSDTSTSDTCLVFATGKAGIAPITTLSDPRVRVLRKALTSVLHELALMIVRDGEGARKMIEVQVTGATSTRSAKRIALSIANSPLVKTAVAGEDANWGRVVMAVGKAGELADRDRLAIWFGEHRVAFQGERDPGYSETAVSEYMTGQDIVIRADIGLGKAKTSVWTCDLTKEYVAINGDYRS